jgi:hypothetical protein
MCHTGPLCAACCHILRCGLPLRHCQAAAQELLHLSF